MSPRIVSPRMVRLLALLLAVCLYIPVMPLEYALIRRADFLSRRPLPILLVLLFFLSDYVLVPVALRGLGIRVRGRSVERFRADGRGGEGDEALDRPIRIRKWQGFMWTLAGGICAIGFLVLWFAWSFPSADRLKVPTGAVGASLLLVGLLLTRVRARTICEIDEEGIRAPDGGFIRYRTFVPWREITRCEIVHDDRNYWHDHFILYDRSGRPRFLTSAIWLGQVGARDRDRIFRALRARFRQNAKPGRAPGPTTTGPSASAVWDREFDG
jgi:hypothetical protein